MFFETILVQGVFQALSENYMIITLLAIQKLLQEIDYHLKENEFFIISLLHILSNVIPIVGETILNNCSDITSILLELVQVSSSMIQTLAHRCLLVIATQNNNTIEELIVKVCEQLQKDFSQEKEDCMIEVCSSINQSFTDIMI